MSLCYDCGKTNEDEALTLIKQQAKAKALETGVPQAVYKEQNEYKFIPAQIAINEQIPYITILSSYS